MFMRFVIAVLSVGWATASSASAQLVVRGQNGRNFETRAELEARARAADEKGDIREALRIRFRLDHGDFQAGDRIVVKVQGSGGFSDTLVVRAGRQLPLPQMADLSLDGVLRSELNPRLTTYIGGFVRDPVVHATPLLRVGVLGGVAHPGFYYAAADLPLSDLLMSAGGPTSDADVAKVSVLRDGQVIIDQNNTRIALTEGKSLDMLNLQAGDEISVGRKRNFNWQVILPTVTGALGLLVAFTQIRHR